MQSTSMASQGAASATYCSLLTPDIGQKNFIRLLYNEIVTGLTHPSRIASDMERVIPLDVQREIMQCESPKKAAEKLFDELLKSEVYGWFEIFKEALKRNKVMVLYKRLSMEDVKNVKKYEEILQIHYRTLIDVNPDQVLPHLYESGCVSKEDLEEIEAEMRNNGKSRAMQKLLLLLPCRTDTWLASLARAMKETGYQPLLQSIHAELPERNSLESMMSVIDKMSIYQRSPGTSPTSPPIAVATCIPRPPPEVETALKEVQQPDATPVDTDPKRYVTETMVKTASGGKTSPKSSLVEQVAVRNAARPPQVRQNLSSDVAVDGGEQSCEIDLRSYPPHPSIEPYSAVASSDNSYSFSPSASSSMTESMPRRRPRSDPGVAREQLVLREYQRELASDGLLGENCLVVAPTGSGKTLIALAIAKNVYDSATMEDDPKIVFFVPTVALVQQQLDQFARYMSKDCRCLGLSGEEDQKIPFSQLVNVNDVLIMTPQIMLNALEKKDVESLSVFSLLIFDECHKMNKNHPYNQIMSAYYVDLLLNHRNAEASLRLPQVVGLTASPGVGQATNSKMAVEHILELCANMAAAKISTVRDPSNLRELSRYENKPMEETEEVQGRLVDPFFDKISSAMEQIEMHIKRNSDIAKLSLDIPNIRTLIVPPSVRGSDPYTQYVSKLKKQIAIIHDQNIRRFYVACLRHLEVYNNALLINADCRTKDAMSFIEKEFELFASNQGSLAIDDTDRWLDLLYTGMKRSLQEISVDPKNENPKLQRLGAKILEFYKENRESLGIVFCKTREMTAALMNWMRESESLAWLNPHNLVGAKGSSGKQGMTHNKLEDVLKFFKDGLHKVIIATSVAEEGLDVRSCNYVIRYEHVTNDVARVQARGRARAENAEYVLLAERGRGTIERDEANRVREIMMNNAINEICHMNPETIQKKVRELQEMAKVERDMATQGKVISNEMKKARLHEGDHELRCLKCNALAAWSSDLRVIQKSHHVTLDDGFARRVKLEPHPRPKKYDDWEKKAKIYCLCGDDWGIKALYKGVPYHVLKAESFVITSPHGSRSQHKKWKDYPFLVEELSLDDMKEMSKKALDGLTASS